MLTGTATTAVFDSSIGDQLQSTIEATRGALEVVHVNGRTENPHLRVLGCWSTRQQGRDSRRQPEPRHNCSAPCAVLVQTGQPLHSWLCADSDSAAGMLTGDLSARHDAGDVAWTIVAHWISKLTGIDIEKLAFDRAPCPRCLSPRGRPVVKRVSDLYFSLSRSGRFVAVAVAPYPVGVDVQVHRPVSSGLLHSLHRAERAYIQRKSDPVLLTRCWSRKEAVLKAMGVGVAHGVSHPLVGAGPLPARVEGYELHDIALTSRFAAAIAYKL